MKKINWKNYLNHIVVFKRKWHMGNDDFDDEVSEAKIIAVIYDEKEVQYVKIHHPPNCDNWLPETDLLFEADLGIAPMNYKGVF